LYDAFHVIILSLLTISIG